ncbi:hypothetical protein ACWEAF_36345 [Streptomyces sp. NPDC005071]
MTPGRAARTILRAGAVALPALAVTQAAPAVSAFGPLRNRLMPHPGRTGTA